MSQVSIVQKGSLPQPRTFGRGGREWAGSRLLGEVAGQEAGQQTERPGLTLLGAWMHLVSLGPLTMREGYEQAERAGGHWPPPEREAGP